MIFPSSQENIAGLSPGGPFTNNGSTLIPAWISNNMPSKMWDEITYSYPNFNGCTVEVWELDKWFHLTLYNTWNYLSMLGLKLIQVSKRGPSFICGQVHNTLVRCLHFWGIHRSIFYTLLSIDLHYCGINRPMVFHYCGIYIYSTPIYQCICIQSNIHILYR